jgi:hypothetical protein
MPGPGWFQHRLTRFRDACCASSSTIDGWQNLLVSNELPPSPLSVAEEALLGAYLHELVQNPVLDPASVPTGARVDDWGHLILEPPFDVRALAVHWGVTQPIAVSTDVRQQSWYLFQRGAELPDEYATRVAAEPVTAAGGRTLRARLTGRPDGPLPDVVAGASPAYDLELVGGLVGLIEIS